MGYVPNNTKWWLAEIIEEITVEGDSRNVVHRNTRLIRADSAEKAYEFALKFGQECEMSYPNPEGKLVKSRFRGLAELSPIHDELEHGAELFYTEDVGLEESKIQALLRSKEELDVFTPWSMPAHERPDYSAKDVVEELESRFGIRTKSK